MDPNQFTEEEQNERRMEFNNWLRKNYEKVGMHTIPANRQQDVHDMLRKAYNAGFNLERRKHLPVRLGGYD